MRLLAVLTVAVLAATLAGCGPGRAADDPEPQPTVTEEPLFATDAEALAAAEKVYREYLLSLDEAFQTGDAKQISTLADGHAEQRAEESVERYVSEGRRQYGSSVITSSSLIYYSGSIVQFHACLDVSEIDVRDSSGQSVLPDKRQTVFPMSIEVNMGPPPVVIDEEVWSGDNFCR